MNKSTLFLLTLTVVFVVLKVTAVVDWSWIAVLSPIWGGFLAGLVVLLVIKVLVRSAK